MRKHILNLTTALFFGMGLLATSCGKDEGGAPAGTNPVPNFPTKVTPTLAAGETYKIDIEPNGPWEVSIPTSGETSKWFWIQDGSQKAFSVRGSAGKSSIVIGTLNEPDYSSEHICDVTMKMKDSNGQEVSQVIATVKIGKLDPKVSVYVCKVEDEDVFLFNPEYNGTDLLPGILKYDYDTTPSTEVSLLWPHGSSNYSFPILVEGNFDWAVVGQLPDWLSDITVSSGKAGVKTEITLKANLKSLPADGDEATITIGNANNKFPFKVKVPSYKQLFKTEFPVEALYNAKGEFYDTQNENFTDQGDAYGQVVSAKSIKFVVFADVKGALSFEASDTDWVTIKDMWNTGSADYAQNRRVEIGAEPHKGPARKAIILGIPASLASTSPAQMISGNTIAEDYKKYVITTLHQIEYYGVFTPKELYNTMLQNGVMFEKLPASSPLFDKFGVTGDGYNLVYTISWSHTAAGLKLEKPYKSYEYFDFDGNPMPSDKSWITVEADNANDPKMMTILMDTAKDPTSAESLSAENIAHKGYIVFSDDTGKFAVIQCIYDEKYDIPVAEPEFVDPTAATVDDGSTLAVLTSGPLYDQYKSYGVPVWHLTYTKKAATMSAVKNLSKFAIAQEKWLTYAFNGAYSTIGMNATENSTSAIILYADQSKTVVKMILVCTLKLS